MKGWLGAKCLDGIALCLFGSVKDRHSKWLKEKGGAATIAQARAFVAGFQRLMKKLKLPLLCVAVCVCRCSVWVGQGGIGWGAVFMAVGWLLVGV